MECLLIDGNYLEGGGQILRTSLALSALANKGFTIEGIRQRRPQPGLKAQHLCAIRAMEQICSAKVSNAAIGSSKVTFMPGTVRHGNYKINIGTAGSIALVLQAILPPLIFADGKSQLEISGGTHTEWAPPIDYFLHIMIPFLSSFAKIGVEILKIGYYPKGGGKVIVSIEPKYHISGFNCIKSFQQFLSVKTGGVRLAGNAALTGINGLSHASLDLKPRNVAERQSESAKMLFESRFDCPVSIKSAYYDACSTGSGITLWASLSESGSIVSCLGSDSLGKPGIKAETVGMKAAENLAIEIGSSAVVDRCLADQILVYMALAGKSSVKTSEITAHSRTNIYTIGQFLGRCFEINEKDKSISTVF